MADNKLEDWQVENSCAVCSGTGGLVWNVPGYHGKWVHLACIGKPKPKTGGKK